MAQDGLNGNGSKNKTLGCLGIDEHAWNSMIGERLVTMNANKYLYVPAHLRYSKFERMTMNF